MIMVWDSRQKNGAVLKTMTDLQMRMKSIGQTFVY